MKALAKPQPLAKRETLTQGARRLYAQQGRQRAAIEAEEDREYVKTRSRRRRRRSAPQPSGFDSALLLLGVVLGLVLVIRLTIGRGII